MIYLISVIYDRKQTEMQSESHIKIQKIFRRIQIFRDKFGKKLINNGSYKDQNL